MARVYINWHKYGPWNDFMHFTKTIYNFAMLEKYHMIANNDNINEM